MLSLVQDISPEDLFPPISFTINDRADEDMPYTAPREEEGKVGVLLILSMKQCTVSEIPAKKRKLYLQGSGQYTDYRWPNDPGCGHRNISKTFCHR